MTNALRRRAVGPCERFERVHQKEALRCGMPASASLVLHEVQAPYLLYYMLLGTDRDRAPFEHGTCV